MNLFFYFSGDSDGKVSAYNAGDQGSIPGSGRSLGEGNGNPLQYSCLENAMDRGAWWATVPGVAESDTTSLWLYFHFVVLGSVLISFFYILLFSFPSTTYWRGCLFSIVCACLLCHRLGGYWCLNLSLELHILVHWSIFLFLCQ